MSEQFSRRQVELILRRTAALERKRDDASDELVSSDDLEKVAAELGMSREALRQAIAEAKVGILAPEEEKTLVDRVFGGRFIEARRFVPGRPEAVAAAVERFLDNQGFELKRHRGDTTVWEPARSVWTRLRRAFGSSEYKLPDDIEIEACVTACPGGPHPVLVRLRVDARNLRSPRVLAGPLALVAGAAAGLAAAVFLPMPMELVPVVAGAAGTLGTLGGRSSYRGASERLSTALERFLDFLEHEPARLPSAQKDPIARVVEFLNGDWWR